jgi:hypothetical protein
MVSKTISQKAKEHYFINRESREEEARGKKIRL